MLVQFPYVYHVRGVLAGQRSIKDHFVADWISVEIEELSGSDVPVSMAWKWGDRGHDTCVRWIGGANFSPSHPSGGADATVLADVKGALAKSIRDRNFSLESMLVKAISGNSDSNAYWKFSRAIGGDLPTCGEVKFRQVVSTDREEIRTVALSIPERMAIVDGRIWLRGGEPCYMLSDSVPGVVTVHSGDIRDVWDVRTTQFYRADRLEDAVEVAQRRWPDLDIRVPYTIDVLIHDAVVFDDEDEAVRRGGRQVLNLIYRDLMDASSEVTRSWVGLKEALAGRCEGNTEVVEAMEGLASQYGEGSEVRGICEHVLRRWAMRPLEIGIPAPG